MEQLLTASPLSAALAVIAALVAVIARLVLQQRKGRNETDPEVARLTEIVRAQKERVQVLDREQRRLRDRFDKAEAVVEEVKERLR